jgi:hypothetical protein
MRISIAVGLMLGCGGTPPAAPSNQPAPDRMDVMSTFTIHGYLLAGAEYWPYAGTDDIKYPDAVLWGFYPVAGELGPGETTPNADTAKPAAVACARRAYDGLRAFLETDPPKLRRIVEAGAAHGYVPRFYLWTNDYTRAASPYPPGVREARLWYWKRKQPEPPKPPGYWKWEASLLQSGECTIPRAAQIEAYLDETLATIEAPPP